ncbi:MAG: methyltransferase [Solirubrobacteraceae bacterium]
MSSTASHRRSAPPDSEPDPAALARLARLLSRAGYKGSSIRGLAGGAPKIGAWERTVIRRQVHGDLAAPVRLFLLGDVVEPTVLEPLGDAAVPGLLERRGSGVRSTVAVQPWRDWLICHDWPARRLNDDFVVPVSAISAALADLTVRRPIARALDVGAGAGVQALVAARHSERVVAVDISPRALRLARWSLGLNGVENVELRRGSLFEPVGDAQFDLIVSNPPFILSPDHRLLYRDGGGTAMTRAIVEGATAHLCEGGFAHVLCEWPLAPGEDWSRPPLSWASGTGCDAWLLGLGGDEDPLLHAVKWNLDLHASDEAVFERAVDRWLAQFAPGAVDRVAFGMLTLRRRRGRNWRRADRADAWPPGPVGEHILRIFAGQTLVSSRCGEKALLDLVLEPADGLRLDETRAHDGTGFHLVAAQPRLTDGIALRPRLSRLALDVISRLDGKATLRDLDASAALPQLRELVALGFLRASGDLL